jgi:hyperosmotically inducible periplasmic protein
VDPHHFLEQIIMKQRLRAIMLAVPFLATSLAVAQASASDRDPAGMDSHTQQPDNSRTNADATNRDASADEQGNGKQDVDLTARIRRSVMGEKGLSTYGHNVKIVSMNGTVTLNGVVKTADEKSTIHRHAAAIAGEGKVVDNLKVKAE